MLDLKKPPVIPELYTSSKNLASFKIPQKIVFLNEIPKGKTGKLQRIGLGKKLGLDQ